MRGGVREQEGGRDEGRGENKREEGMRGEERTRGRKG